jgi:hypothetical protein
MQSKATSVEAYLASLPDDRRAAISAVRQLILDNIDPAFEEGMTYGMIGYYVPHSLYPAGYHCDPKQPLPYISLASQKQHMSLYMMCLYFGEENDKFAAEWAKTGKKLDMGKSCIRFKKLEQLATDVIAEAIRSVSAAAYIASYERSRASESQKAPAKKAAKKASSAKS